MRAAHRETLDQVKIRAKLDDKQMDELSKLVASTFGPIVISSMVERGLLLFRKQENGKIKRTTKKTK